MATLTVQPSGKDTYLRENAPTTNFSTETKLRISSVAANNLRSILEFDISALPAGATITSATLGLYYFAIPFGDPVGRTYWAYRLTRTDWVEAEACWSYYKGTTVWTAAGGDYTTDDGASQAMPAGFGWVSWNVLVQTQYAQTNTIAVELLVRDGTESNDPQKSADFYSKEGSVADTTLRPKLVIEYTPLAVGRSRGFIIG